MAGVRKLVCVNVGRAMIDMIAQLCREKKYKVVRVVAGDKQTYTVYVANRDGLYRDTPMNRFENSPLEFRGSGHDGHGYFLRVRFKRSDNQEIP